jgi:hypothetical protein
MDTQDRDSSESFLDRVIFGMLVPNLERQLATGDDDAKAFAREMLGWSGVKAAREDGEAMACAERNSRESQRLARCVYRRVSAEHYRQVKATMLRPRRARSACGAQRRPGSRRVHKANAPPSDDPGGGDPPPAAGASLRPVALPLEALLVNLLVRSAAASGSTVDEYATRVRRDWTGCEVTLRAFDQLTVAAKAVAR